MNLSHNFAIFVSATMFTIMYLLKYLVVSMQTKLLQEKWVPKCVIVGSYEINILIMRVMFSDRISHLNFISWK